MWCDTLMRIITFPLNIITRTPFFFPFFLLLLSNCVILHCSYIFRTMKIWPFYGPRSWGGILGALMPLCVTLYPLINVQNSENTGSYGVKLSKNIRFFFFHNFHFVIWAIKNYQNLDFFLQFLWFYLKPSKNINILAFFSQFSFFI